MGGMGRKKKRGSGAVCVVHEELSTSSAKAKGKGENRPKVVSGNGGGGGKRKKRNSPKDGPVQPTSKRQRAEGMATSSGPLQLGSTAAATAYLTHHAIDVKPAEPTLQVPIARTSADLGHSRRPAAATALCLVSQPRSPPPVGPSMACRVV